MVVAAVALGCIFGGLAASVDKRAAASASAASDLGWMPDHVRESKDPLVKLAYRRDVIAAAVKEWRAAVTTLGAAGRFELDAGPLGSHLALDAADDGNTGSAMIDSSSGGGGGGGLGDGGVDGGDGRGGGGVVTGGKEVSSRAASGSDCDPHDPLLPEGGALRLHPEPSMPADVKVDDALRALIVKTRSEDKCEVMLGLANGVMICKNPKICWWNGGNILESFLDVTWRRLGVRNLILAVLDDETDAYMKSKWPDVPTFRPKTEIPSTQDGTHPANRVSTLKYDLLRKFIATGTAVLITDLDLVYVQNPFAHLRRDADIEGQTDGFSEKWSHGQLAGVTDKSMGWGAGGLYAQVFTINVGCMYVRPTARAARLMARVAARMASEKGWDQQIFNEEAMFPAHGDSTTGLVSIRILEYTRFVNSKTFFKSERRRFIPGRLAASDALPVMVHMNYHPDKHRRMLCLIERYHDGKVGACDDMPGGSEPGT